MHIRLRLAPNLPFMTKPIAYGDSVKSTWESTYSGLKQQNPLFLEGRLLRYTDARHRSSRSGNVTS